MTRPFRFGVQSFHANSGKAWAEQAVTAERLGYSTFHLADHIIGAGPALERTNHPLQNLAAVPAMAYAAAVTSQIKIGCRVFCIDYHLPVVLIKEAMTIDLLSDGRLELGLGAGWLADEYQAIGLSMDSPGQRIDRLRHVVEATKAYAGPDQLAIDNADIQWREFEGTPNAFASRTPPIMIGGGSPKVLRLAGEVADIVSLNFNNRKGVIGPDGVQKSTAEETAKKLRWIKEGAGDRFDQLELEIGAYFTFVTEDKAPIVAGFAQNFGTSPEAMLEHPHALFGSVDEICETLEHRREQYGISYVTVGHASMESFAPVVARLTGK